MSLNPIRINSHSGFDGWTQDEVSTFYREAIRIESDKGALVAHETHRGRCFFNPWLTVRMIRIFPDLKLCADFSHWVCVCERLLTDEEDIIRECAPRVIHIHARVGYENGPQVPDPRAPEWQVHVETHEKWWRWIWDSQRERRLELMTLTPEFGPPSYLHTLPYTRSPVTDLCEVCDWQAERQIGKYALWNRSIELSETTQHGSSAV